jgi:RecB family exonuclease
MHSPPSFRLVEAASAAVRLQAAASFLLTRPSDRPATIVGASRGAADDLARRVAAARPATFGVLRLSLSQLAARTTLLELAVEGRTPSTWLGAEAVTARATFEAARDGALHYFGPVAATPGFPRALARTLHELRLAGLGGSQLSGPSPACLDLAELADRVAEAFEAAAAVDRADLFRAAAAIVSARPRAGTLVLLDLPVHHAAERAFVQALVHAAETTVATVPHADRVSMSALVEIGGRPELISEPGTGDLALLRAHLFDSDTPRARRELDGSLELFSAPGEGRECVEIARRILRCAREGTRFDEMAILIRSPHSYFGLVEHALRRARVPAWFDKGTRRPHPAGRAFLALLACAAEELSAARFAEYISLGQVPAFAPSALRRASPLPHSALRRASPVPPSALRQGAPDNAPPWEPSLDDAFGRPSESPDDEWRLEDERDASEPAHADDEVVAGTLRAPWKWEALLGEAAVIGQSAARWKRRLDGRARELTRQIDEATRLDGGESGRVRALGATRDQLAMLQSFALPIVETLAAWPASATWGEWLTHFERLVPRVLRTPEHVLRVLADLRPMADVGPIDLDEARRVLTDRLLSVQLESPARRFGRVFVGTPEQARGRSFRVVFVPGLAERLFPQKPREDPLLLDHLRQSLGPALPTQDRRLADERLLLQLAVGAASERLFVSYPRIELTESRARVPSFYALDLMRAATGRLPDHEVVEERARQAGNASLAWPAPAQPEDAIDDLEHDLAVLRRLLDDPDPDAVKGHAHYLLGLNDCLRRSVTDRWLRGRARWTPSDGLVRSVPQVAEALAAERLGARSYSLSALQRFSACPYQFTLSAIFRLQPLEQPEPLQRMDPLTRGSLFHEIQAHMFRELRSAGALPVTTAIVATARDVLGRTIDRVSAQAHDELAPAVERVWADEIASIRRDLEAWLELLARDGEEWEPKFFEWAFGPVPGERDPHSVPDEVVLAGRFRLRGAIDLIEEHRQTRELRVTDHKTGRRPDRIDKAVVDGGRVLQPVLYAMAVEAALARPVSHGRLFYCTSVGGFTPVPIPLNDRTRAAGLEVLEVIDRALAAPFLVAAPHEDACGRCDFRPVCGPDVVRRIWGKPKDALADLIELRRRP